MTIVIKTILEESRKKDNYFELTSLRFFSLFQPLQAIENKQSEYTSLFVNPVIDFFLAPVFAIDLIIHLCNAVASLAKAAYLWSMHQRDSADLIDSSTMEELGDAGSHLLHAGSAFVAKNLNFGLSLLSLIIRPLVSVIYAVIKCCSEAEESGINYDLNERGTNYSGPYPSHDCFGSPFGYPYTFQPVF